MVPGPRSFIKNDVHSCVGRAGLLKVHPSSASQALLEEEVARFPFKGDPATWVLSISWGPNTGVEGCRLSTAFPDHQARHLRTERPQRRHIGACFLSPTPNQELWTALGHRRHRACLRKGQLPGAGGEKSEREAGQEAHLCSFRADEMLARSCNPNISIQGPVES